MEAQSDAAAERFSARLVEPASSCTAALACDEGSGEARPSTRHNLLSSRGPLASSHGRLEALMWAKRADRMQCIAIDPPSCPDRGVYCSLPRSSPRKKRWTRSRVSRRTGKARSRSASIAELVKAHPPRLTRQEGETRSATAGDSAGSGEDAEGKGGSEGKSGAGVRARRCAWRRRARGLWPGRATRAAGERPWPSSSFRPSLRCADPRHRPECPPCSAPSLLLLLLRLQGSHTLPAPLEVANTCPLPACTASRSPAEQQERPHPIRPAPLHAQVPLRCASQCRSLPLPVSQPRPPPSRSPSRCVPSAHRPLPPRALTARAHSLSTLWNAMSRNQRPWRTGDLPSLCALSASRLALARMLTLYRTADQHD